jgi:hypothetical protein
MKAADKAGNKWGGCELTFRMITDSLFAIDLDLFIL